MSMIGLIITICIILLILIALETIITIYRGITSETGTESLPVNGPEKVGQVRQIEVANSSLPVGDILIYSGIAVIITAIIFLFIYFKPIRLIKKWRVEKKKSQFLKSNPSVKAVLDLASVFDERLQYKYPNLTKMLDSFRWSFKQSHFNNLDRLCYEYMHEVEFIKVLNQHSSSLSESEKYLKELDETILRNISEERKRIEEDILNIELNFYRKLNSKEV